MKKKQKWLGLIAGVVASLAISSTSMAAELPLDNRLPAWDDYGTETVDFTNINIDYVNGKKKKGIIGDTRFFGESTETSVFNLNGPDDRGTVFDGYLVIDAKLSSRGRLRDGSTFSIYSQDAMFGTGREGEYACNTGGKQCSTGQLVYGGDLTSFGWSGTAGILEFTIANLSGWALDTWLGGDQSTRTEHLMLNIAGGFDLGGVSSVKAFTATADGFAVVPVPAAVWLFGSGLIGLVGLARRKRV